MKVSDEKDLKICIGDIETLKCCLDFGFYNPDEDKWYEFQINEYQNDLYKFIKFYNKINYDYIVWFNGLGFDTQVIQFILNESEKWFNKTNLEICAIVYQWTQDLIDDMKYSNFTPCREYQLEIPAIDVYTILGLDNEARRSSLKKCEFQLDYFSVEEMPIHHGVEELSIEEVQEVISYRRNDVLATYELFKLVLGETNHPIYKGNNQLSLRFDIKEEFGIDCINYSDIKIGDELLKHSYAKEIGKTVADLPKKGFFRKEIKLKFAIPKYVDFQTPQLKQLLKETKAKIIKQTEKHESEFTFKGTTYTIGLGGGHSDNTSEIWQSDSKYQLVDLDVGSLYPAIIVNNSYFPYHLGKNLLNVYKKLYERRIELKPLAKKDKKINGIVGAIKLILNSAYGKMGSMLSWMFDKQVQVNVCLTGQFALLMLIEDMELNGFHVFSFNTDGITIKMDRSREELFKNICSKWEEKTDFILERVDYKKIIYSTVNDYLAITEEGKIKKKGDFISDYELWKNKSYRIVALALEQYFVNGVSPEQFIRNHKNIYDFCIMTRATGEMHLELQNNNGEIKELKKLVRYYLSSTSKWQLFKRGTGTTGKSANISTNAANELGEIYIEYYNQHKELKNFEDYNIDYNQYIFKAYKIIAKVEKNKKHFNFVEQVKNVNQLSLF